MKPLDNLSVRLYILQLRAVKGWSLVNLAIEADCTLAEIKQLMKDHEIVLPKPFHFKKNRLSNHLYLHEGINRGKLNYKDYLE